jgi:NAD(P)-dependent dehydrogenase (short-subunit alcohol dehydrogenase family)
VLEILPGPIETDMLLASDKPAAAIEHERYRAQAEKLWEGRQNIRAMYTPTAEAARRIADAILDDNAPLRAGCDDLSDGMLAGWRKAASDEAWMKPLLASFTQA